MIRAAIVGLGRWGQNLVECAQDKSDKIRFTAGVARTPAKARAFAESHGIALVADYAAALADPSIDAVVAACALAAVSVKGFSVKTCLPARAAAMICSACCV